MYQRQFDALIAFAGADRFKQQLLATKAEYFGATGEIFEDDRSFDMRMAGFLDHFVFDKILPQEGKTPAQLFLDEIDPATDQSEKEVMRGFTETLHSLYEVRKIAPELVRLRDCFNGKDIDVFERRQMAGLKKGDIIEARLIPVQGQYLFSQAFCFHPAEARKTIARQIKLLKKQEPEFSKRDFIWLLSRMRLKYERYRNISLSDIYAFVPPTKR